MNLKTGTYIVIFLCLPVTAKSQGSPFCDYENAWKIESVEAPEGSFYIEMLECNFFISEDGHTGCYVSDANEIFCQCCWKRKGDIFIENKKKKHVKYRVMHWDDKSIILTPLDERGTLIVLKK